MKFSKFLSHHNCTLTSWYNIFIVSFAFLLYLHYQWVFSLSREEVMVLGNIHELTCPCKVTPVTVPSTKPAPSAMAMSSGAPQEPLFVKLETTTVNVMGSYSDWLTLGLPIDFHVPPPTKLLGNRSQHVCPLCGDIKMSSNGAYNHIWTEHVGILLQYCFCSWSSGSARMIQEHLLKFHWKDDGWRMKDVGLEPTPRATRH